jgi:hypothetical protein
MLVETRKGILAVRGSTYLERRPTGLIDVRLARSRT